MAKRDPKAGRHSPANRGIMRRVVAGRRVHLTLSRTAAETLLLEVKAGLQVTSGSRAKALREVEAALEEVL